MGLKDKLKDLIGLEEIEDDDEDITEEEIEAAAAKMERKPVETRSYTSPVSASKTERKPFADSKEFKDNRDSKVTPMTRTSTATTAFKLVVIEPSSFDECPKLVDNLKARKPVIINLANLDPGIARKIFDFLSGATYALNGNVQRIADSIFVFAPENVDITANIEHKGIDFSNGKQSIWR